MSRMNPRKSRDEKASPLGVNPNLLKDPLKLINGPVPKVLVHRMTDADIEAARELVRREANRPGPSLRPRLVRKPIVSSRRDRFVDMPEAIPRRRQGLRTQVASQETAAAEGNVPDLLPGTFDLIFRVGLVLLIIMLANAHYNLCFCVLSYNEKNLAFSSSEMSFLDTECDSK